MWNSALKTIPFPREQIVGMSRDQVLHKYGEPGHTMDGEPWPESNSWIYYSRMGAGACVFFENDVAVDVTYSVH